MRLRVRHRSEYHHLISIHAPQWGATISTISELTSHSYFNPRTPVGCDLVTNHVEDLRVIISIHAPQWGATVLPQPSLLASIFQSTHPSGVRLQVAPSPSPTTRFQSTHPSGVRRGRPSTRLTIGDFNPRTPVGCDLFAPPRHGLFHVFQSTHPSGVRHLMIARQEVICRFQSTHPSGVRRAQRPAPAHQIAISIHAPQWGATARMGIAFHNMEAPPVLKTDFIAKIHVHRSIHKFSNQKHQQTIHF